jgi:hypothetical protein
LEKTTVPDITSPPNGWTPEEVSNAYPDLIEFLAGIGRHILLLPLDQLAEVNEQMQAVAPFLEPTAYQRGCRRNLADQRRVIDAAAEFQRVLQSLDPAPAGG